MALLSTGPLTNEPVDGMRPTQQVTIKLDNRDPVNYSVVLLEGYVLNGTRSLYVQELFSIQPDAVVTKKYPANYDAFQFVFTTSGPAAGSTEISFWGKGLSGQLLAAYRLVSNELQV
ncbi:hypothetical protein [Paenibacillus lignilyticus]|uniref:Uncharacterized protein n=1 Tax=Paenibacillus lignilyticus TaxID=1172615 RepID=A0ABS5CAH0_9BACL|nr:hypothetical protein [Paenibacillus lignilyticus]MBP3962993.1 hypothetical protein [Paenibacillus lignilyticus]